MPVTSTYKIRIIKIGTEASITINIFFQYDLKTLVNKSTTKKSVISSIKLPL